MKRYEGLFILNTAGKEEGVKELIDRLTADINAAGGRVETVQKMDKRPFSRVANKRYSTGYYANFVFSIEPNNLSALKHKFDMTDEVFRVLFTVAPEPKATVSAPAV